MKLEPEEVKRTAKMILRYMGGHPFKSFNYTDISDRIEPKSSAEAVEAAITALEASGYSIETDGGECKQKLTISGRRAATKLRGGR
ncbi:hypothetical protein N9878_00785 [bacterium]|nr:hypothetical protein [bacterium]